MSRTPNYVLTTDYRYYKSQQDSGTIPAGSFVRPLELTYVPKHVIDNPLWKQFDVKEEYFCYTKFGIIVIPKSYLREV